MIRHEHASKWIIAHGNNQPTILAFVEDGLLITDGEDVFFLYINSTHHPVALAPGSFFDTEEAARARLIELFQSEMDAANRFIAERSAALADLQSSPLMGETGAVPVKNRLN